MSPTSGSFKTALSWDEIYTIGKFWGLCLWRLTLRPGMPIEMEMNDTFLILLGPQAVADPPLTLEDFTSVYVHPDDREEVSAALAACLDKDLGDFTFEHRLYHPPSGQWRWVRTVAMSTELNTNDNSLHIFGATRDVQLFYTALDELKHLRQKLHQSQANLAARLKISDLVVWSWNLSTGEKIYLNPAPASDENRESKNWATMLPQAEQQVILAEAKRHAAGRTPIFASEFTLRGESGEQTVFLEIGKIVARDSGGQGVRLMGILVEKEAWEADQQTDPYMADFFIFAPLMQPPEHWSADLETEEEIKTSSDN